MSRAIKIFGAGYNDTDNNANIEIKIDDDVIHSGEISTTKQDEAGPYFGKNDDGYEIASWVEDNAASTKKLSIKVSEGFFSYKETLTTLIDGESTDNPELRAVHMYKDDDGDIVSDPNTNVQLDGAPYLLDLPEKHRDEIFGQWDIIVQKGETMTCDLIIDEGQVHFGFLKVKETPTSTSFEVDTGTTETSYEYVSGGTVTTFDDSVFNIANFEYDNSTGSTIITTSEDHGLSGEDIISISDVTLSYTEDGETKETVYSTP